MLGIFIGPGLLRHRPGWRTCAFVFLWIALIFIPLITIIMFNASSPLDFSIFGQKQGHTPKEFALVIGVLLFFLNFWQYRVLTRPDIRSLFIPPLAWMSAR